MRPGVIHPWRRWGWWWWWSEWLISLLGHGFGAVPHDSILIHELVHSVVIRRAGPHPATDSRIILSRLGIGEFALQVRQIGVVLWLHFLPLIGVNYIHQIARVVAQKMDKFIHVDLWGNKARKTSVRVAVMGHINSL